MNILVFSTRLAGTDGVSLETLKMRRVFERQGHTVHYCAGELSAGEPNGHLIPEMHFNDEVARALGQRAFASEEPDAGLVEAISARASLLLDSLREVVKAVGPQLMVVQNAWAIPMQLPLGMALGWLAEESALPVLAHNHDYWWERERFASNCVRDLLGTYFPYGGERVVHLCINSQAQRELRQRRQLASLLLPNVLDFEAPPPTVDDYNRDFRQAIGLGADRLLLLQPTRVVPRKGIDLAIDLAACLDARNPALVITHAAGDEGGDYLQKLRKHASQNGVDLRYVADQVDDIRRTDGGKKLYSLWDAYPHANFVTYPSLYEGFGNALVEAVWFRQPVLVNRYSVYIDDIAPKGFRFVEIDGEISRAAAAQVVALLDDPAETRRLTDHNFELGRQHFSYQALQRILAEATSKLGLAL